MSRIRSISARLAPSFPRVSGDEPVWEKGGIQQGEFSPRERG